MKKVSYFLGFFFLLFLFFIFFWPLFLKDGQYLNLELKDNFFATPKKTFKVRVVKDEKNLKQGLSNRNNLSDGESENIEAMLFVLPSKKIANFWMKDMNFDIDICWIKDKSLFNCERDTRAKEVDPETNELKVFNSAFPVEMVLETNPGFIEEDQLVSIFPQKSIFFLF